MGEFKPRNPDTDLLYRGEKKIADSINRNAKAIKSIDLSEVNVEVNTENISDAILESATANSDALEGVAGVIQNVQRYIDYSEKLQEIVNAISALNYGEELQGEIYEIQNEIKEIIENYEKLKSDYEETTEETLGDITLLNENYENLLQNLTNLTETVNNIIEKIGDIPSNVSEELAEIKEELEELKSKIANIPDNVEEELEEIKSVISSLTSGNVFYELKYISHSFNLGDTYAEMLGDSAYLMGLYNTLKINISDYFNVPGTDIIYVKFDMPSIFDRTDYYYAIPISQYYDRADLTLYFNFLSKAVSESTYNITFQGYLIIFYREVN